MKRTMTVPAPIVLAATALVAVAVTAGCSAAADESSAPSAAPDAATVEREITAAYEEWNASLATGDPEAVAARYTEDGLLLSTLSADIKEGREEIAAYFDNDFLPKKPQGVLTESHVLSIDADSAVHNGLYDFTITAEEGETKVVPARYTYVYEKVDGDWLIASHHSSVQPEG